MDLGGWRKSSVFGEWGRGEGVTLEGMDEKWGLACLVMARVVC